MNDEFENRSGSEGARWKWIDQLLEQALEIGASERASFLEKTCGGDAKLRAEVEELLAAHDKAGSFLDAPAMEVAAKEMAKGKAGSLVERRLGPYEVQALLGAGGMGEVYRARDTRLDRTVAIKILPLEFTSDEERMRRFRREAKAASALNHPNVGTIYDVGDSDGILYIAMEYVEGKSLDGLIGRKGMRLNDALKCGMQIADALATAHEARIVHRDLKPGNLMVTGKGQVKVLDFGLAKLREKVSFGHDESTATAQPTTEEAKIVGTVAYMSPEQAEGKPVDARSDIFSFGSVLYEMVTGRRAFQGETPSSTLAAILKDNPRPASELVKTLPKEVERLISRCLRKDIDHRFQHMDDIKIALEELKEESDSGALEAPGPPVAGVRGRLWRAGMLGGMAVIVVALGITGWFWLSRLRSVAEETPLTAIPLTTYPGAEHTPSFSPDGNYVAFQWCPEGPGTNCDIYIKQIGEEPPFRLTNDPAEEFSPAWSPDGRYIAFLRRLSLSRAALILIPQRGGQERVLGESNIPQCCWDGPYLAWTPDSKWLAVPWTEADKGDGLFLLSAETEEKQRLTTLPAGFGAVPAMSGEVGDTAPAFSPDGRTLGFTRVRGIRSDICLLQLAEGYVPQGEPQQVTSDSPFSSSLAWTPDGSDILFSSGRVWSMGRNSELWRMAASTSVKARRLALTSEFASEPAISRQGKRLAYKVERYTASVWRIDLRSPDQSPSGPVQFISSTRMDLHPAYSPDGNRIAFASTRSGTQEIWVCNSDGSNAVQLTSLGGAGVRGPRWSPDGQKIACHAFPGGVSDVYVISARGGVSRRLTADPAEDKWPYWSRDGRWLYFTSLRGGSSEIWKMPAAGGEAVQITPSGEERDVPQESPDGQFLYYQKGWPLQCSVWRMPVGGGEEVKVLDSIHNDSLWTVGKEGIYFFTQPDQHGRSDIRFYEFADGKTRKIITIERRVTSYIAVSPDGRTIIYPQLDQSGSDLMLVENFR